MLIPPFCPGPPNCVWFHVLKLSARNSTRLSLLSLSTNSLKSDRFQFCRPGPVRALNGRFPHVPAAGAAKAAVLNHALTVFGYEIGPTRSGRVRTSPPEIYCLRSSSWLRRLNYIRY